MGLSNRYPAEFKRAAITLARTSGRKKKEIAESLGISEQRCMRGSKLTTKTVENELLKQIA
jgi:transposase-like protein